MTRKTEPAPEAPAETPKPEDKAAHWAPLEGLRREIDHLFEAAHRGEWRNPFTGRSFDFELPSLPSGDLAPAVDLHETAEGHELSVEVPGVAPSEIEVKVAGDRLTVRGEKTEERREEAGERVLSERRYGAFSRSFRLPEGVDPEAIEAHAENGVLTVRLPRKAGAEPPARKIAVKSG